MKFFCFLTVFLFNVVSFARVQMPANMNAADRQRALEILGLNSASKLLDDPIPLGGFSGVEMGLQTVLIPVGDLAALGDKPIRGDSMNYTLVTLGKGLYENIDIFLDFSPIQNAEDVRSVGGQARWGFYQSDNFPAYLSLVMGVQSNNYQNLITTVATSVDLVAGIRMRTVALFTGFGSTRATGSFVESGDSHESVGSHHALAGFSVKVDRIFLAAQMDRYKDTVYSAKLGYRY